MARLIPTAACLLWLAATLLPASSLGQWVVETNSFRIKEPSNLAGEFDAAIGDFGVPLYGASLVGELVYLTANDKGCSVFDKHLTGKAGNLPVILLVDRGDCYFVEKAWNAENGGAKAVLVADYKDEKLLTMAAPEDRPEISKLKNDITIPTALITKEVGDKLKAALAKQEDPAVVVELDWKESMMHPDERVEWDFWTTSNDGCGVSCDRQTAFKKEFRDSAVELEKGGYTQFTPHFMVRRCSYASDSPECADNCLHHGRYCAVDSIGDAFTEQFKGWQVVEENKRQLCIFKQANEKSQPWLWWDYVAAFAEHCTMAANQFNADCAHQQLQALGLDASAVQQCMGDSTSDTEHPLLEADYVAQGDDGWGQGKILLLPTVVINTKQYRGRLDVPSVMRAVCAGFSEATEPAVCMSSNLNVNDCVEDASSCWSSEGVSACVDTFRGHVCQCPAGWRGDGTNCEDIDECAEGSSGCDQICVNEPGSFHCECKDGFTLFGGSRGVAGFCFPKDRCLEDNGGCEELCSSHNGEASCSCRAGLRVAVDGKACEDIDECAEHTAKCEGGCENKDPRQTGLEYTCTCEEGTMVDPGNQYNCVKSDAFLTRLGLSNIQTVTQNVGIPTIAGILVAAVLLATLAGYAVHKLRMRRVMQTEIQAIMRQYMPLENEDGGVASLLSPRGKTSGKISSVVQHGDEEC
ncbi:hypothetical protein WJX72_005862 [[Myrmecia] bisecta]|uniref:EGF-like domain-containing protein n=1 Tax=[Myrmecia] bisecta TaxID=41462 RepID=A0AAW1P2Q6_9CHLO